MKKPYRLIALLLSLLLLVSILPLSAAATDGEVTPPPAGDGGVTPPPVVDPLEALPFTLSYFFSSAEYDEQTKTLNFFVPDDLEEVELTLVFDEGQSGTVYADSALTQTVKLGKNGRLMIHPAQMYTYLYIRCNDIAYRISVISMRTPMKYRDDNAIADWARVYVNYCNELGYGIIQGDQNHNANPNSPLTRYEIALIAARMLGTDTTLFSSAKLPYKDGIAKWAKSGVSAMTTLGIISGHKVEKEFYYHGDDNVTREQVAKIMVELALLHAYFPNARVTLLGDPMQRTCPGMDACLPENWGECFDVQDAPIFHLTRCYRSTLPITRLCNALLPGGERLNPFGREGEMPMVAQYSEKLLRETLDRLRGEGHQSIAVITRTQAQADSLSARLSNVYRLDGGDADLNYESTDNVVACYHQVKGMEFDAVIVVWPEAELDDGERRRLYTACSRALHSVTLLGGGKLIRELGIVL